MQDDSEEVWIQASAAKHRYIRFREVRWMTVNQKVVYRQIFGDDAYIDLLEFQLQREKCMRLYR